MTETNFSRLKIASLKLAKFNPKNRLEGPRLKQLARSIEEVGLIYPVCVNQDNELIDGHRRVAAAKSLGWDEIPVILVNGDRQMIYAEVNHTSQRMSANDHLMIYLSDPSALRPQLRRRHDEAEALLGRKVLTIIAHRGGSINLVRWAKEMASYCDRAGDEKFIIRAVRWVSYHRMARLVRSAMAGGASPRIIERCIMRNKPLTPTYRVKV